jgi:predicted DNA-binding transcriptional regulator AlpA
MPTLLTDPLAKARAAKAQKNKTQTTPMKRKYTRTRSLRFMSRQAVAQLLGVHPLTVIRMEEDGRLPKPSRFGSKTTRHERALIEQFLQDSAQ